VEKTGGKKSQATVPLNVELLISNGLGRISEAEMMTISLNKQRRTCWIPT
jgi:hypothetical protein